jgi:hypothetical protein
MERETAYYLYCLMPGASVRASLIGVDGHPPVTVLACEEIGAVLSQVELGEFCGEAAEARLQDLAWLTPRVLRHETVIEELMSRTPVLPARFATLFTSVDSLRRSVLENRAAITGFFTQLRDKQEWAVKGLLARSEALRMFGSSGEVNLSAASPGARYFAEKRLKAQLERDFNLGLKEFCRRAAAALGAQAVAFRERKIVMPAAAGTAEVVLNWAFLLPPAALAEFQAGLDLFNGGEAFPGLTLTLTGPWPAYSFAPDLSAGPQA